MSLTILLCRQVWVVSFSETTCTAWNALLRPLISILLYRFISIQEGAGHEHLPVCHICWTVYCNFYHLPEEHICSKCCWSSCCYICFGFWVVSSRDYVMVLMGSCLISIALSFPWSSSILTISLFWGSAFAKYKHSHVFISCFLWLKCGLILMYCPSYCTQQLKYLSTLAVILKISSYLIDQFTKGIFFVLVVYEAP